MTAAFGTGQIVGPVVAGYLADRSRDFLLARLAAIVIPADSPRA
jgi:predicted MFS family arabinose efflux permease